MSGPTGEAYLSTLNATGLSREEVLAREGIQNTSDASHATGQKPVIRFRKKVLVGTEAKNFAALLHLQVLEERKEVLGLGTGNLFDRNTKGLEIPLLFVEDFGTCGLFGDPHDPGSHFYRLLLSLGDSAKSRERDDSGGSYGFGKAAYFLNSRIHTIVAHSGFQAQDQNKFESRLFGCGFFKRHEKGSQSYTGRAWFGMRKRGADLTPIVDPVSGSAAMDLATRLGFQPRSGPDEQGTSMLIVDADINLDSLTKAIETWWWPKLLEHEIDVSIVDEASNETHYPRPKRREDLKPFMNAYEVCLGRVEPARPHQKLEEFNRTEQLGTGTCGFVALSEEQESAIEEEQRNCIALIRGHRMVIQYYPVTLGSPVIVGCFIGHADSERYLKLSEPPAHNQWDHRADRLSTDGGRGARLVKSIIERIRRKARDFQNSATPPAPPRANRLQRLERALGRYFMMKDDGKEPPVPVDAPIHLSFLQEPTTVVVTGGLLKMKCKFEVRLKENVESMRLRLKTSCVILEDETHMGDDLNFALEPDVTVSTPVANDPTTVEFALFANERARFTVLTATYDPNWSLKFRPEVTPA